VVQNEHTHEVVTDKAAKESARKAVDADPEGQKQRMLDMVRANRGFESKEEVAVMKEVMDRAYESDHAVFSELAIGQQMARTKSAQAMQAFHDDMKTPEARAREARGVLAAYRKPAIKVKAIQDQLAAAQKKAASGAAPEPSAARKWTQAKSSQASQEFKNVVAKWTKRFGDRSQPNDATTIAEVAYDLSKALVKMGVTKFADVALAIADNLRAFRWDPKYHRGVEAAWERMRVEHPELEPAGNMTAVVNGDKRFALEKRIERAQERYKKTTERLQKQKDEFAAMTVAERELFLNKEAARNEPPPEVREIMDTHRDEIASLREQIAGLSAEAKPKEAPTLEQMIAHEHDRLENLRATWEAKHERLSNMTPQQRLAEAESKKLPEEITDIRRDAMRDMQDLRKRVDLMANPGKQYRKPAGPKLPPDMLRANRQVEKLKKKLADAQKVDAAHLAKTKTAAKAEGFDVDNLDAPMWKDPGVAEHFMDWMNARNAGAFTSFMKGFVIGTIHASPPVSGKKIAADLVGGFSETAKGVLSPIMGSMHNGLRRFVGNGAVNGLPTIGEYRHVIGSLGDAFKDAFSDSMRVVRGENSKFEAYTEHSKYTPMLAKTSPGTFARGVVRAGQWASLMTPVRIIHAFATNFIGRLKVAAHAYRTAIDENGKRLTGDKLDKHLDSEIGNLTSESWRKAVLDAQRVTFTEPLPAPVQKFVVWKSSPGKNLAEDVAKLAVTSQLPFAHIPFNRVKQAVMNWSPVLGDAMTLARFFLKKGQTKNKPGERLLSLQDIPDTIVQTALRWGVGIGAVSLVGQTAEDGNPVLIGNNKDHKLAYTIYFNGHRFNYLEAGAAGPGIGLFADAAQGGENGKKNAASGVAEGIHALMTEHYQDPLISPIIDALNTYKFQPHDRETFDKLKSVIAQRIGGTVGSLSPSFIRQVQNAWRDTNPEYKLKSNKFDFYEEIKHAMTIKAAPDLLPDKEGAKGPKDKFDSDGATVLWRLLSPFPMGRPTGAAK
jgi:hypothetical protein